MIDELNNTGYNDVTITTAVVRVRVSDFRKCSALKINRIYPKKDSPAVLPSLISSVETVCSHFFTSSVFPVSVSLFIRIPQRSFVRCFFAIGCRSCTSGDGDARLNLTITRVGISILN
jgi:hypothetical protein